MKGLIFDIKKYSVNDGPGIRTTIFFKGCPLNCWWCHNPESRSPDPEKSPNGELRKSINICFPDTKDNIGQEVTDTFVMNEILKDIVFYEESNGGVTFSGGEPLLQPEFLLTLLKQCKEKGIHTAVDTSGYVEFSLFESLYDYVDLFLYDLKIINKNEHLENIGVSNELILNNLKALDKKDKNVQIRIPLIPGYTDTPQNLNDTAKFLNSLKNINKIALLPYNEIGENKYKKLNKSFLHPKLKEQSEKHITEIAALLTLQGFDVNIRG